MYHVCSFVGIGTLPPPLSQASVLLPPEPKGGGTLTKHPCKIASSKTTCPKLLLDSLYAMKLNKISYPL